MELHSVATTWHWLAFLIGICLLLALDLGVFNRKAHAVSVSRALAWSGFWIALSLAFNAYVWWAMGSELALEFLAAYVIEKSLSVDNIFVFVLIFRYMQIDRSHLHRVLFFGIFGALVLRALFIFAGLSLIKHFTWTLYLFGAFLLFTGIKLLLPKAKRANETGEAQGSGLVKRLATRYLRITDRYDGPKFMVRHPDDGKWHATPLLVALLMVESADVVFAVDSIPAIFGVSRDPFIVFTSNVCAILGLRALFFVLENLVDRFRYLSYGLGFILGWIGCKMILAQGLGGLVPDRLGLGLGSHPWLEPIHVSTGWSLAVIGLALVLSILVSLWRPAGPR